MDFLYAEPRAIGPAGDRRMRSDMVPDQELSSRAMLKHRRDARDADPARRRKRPPAHPIHPAHPTVASAELGQRARRLPEQRSQTRPRKPTQAQSNPGRRRVKTTLGAKHSNGTKISDPSVSHASSKSKTALPGRAVSSGARPLNAKSTLNTRNNGVGKQPMAGRTVSHGGRYAPVKTSLRSVKLVAESPGSHRKPNEELLYLPVPLPSNTFLTASRTSGSSGSPPVTTNIPWGPGRPAWEAASSPIVSDTGSSSPVASDTGSVASPQSSEGGSAELLVDAPEVQPTPQKSGLPRCAVVNFSREGDVVKWTPRATENTGGVAARVRDFDDAFKLEELSSRNFGSRFLSSVSASPHRGSHRQAAEDLPGQWAARVRELSNDRHRVEGGRRAYLGAAIGHARQCQSHNFRDVVRASEISNVIARDRVLVEESREIAGFLPAANTSPVKREANPFLWTRNRISNILTKRTNGGPIILGGDSRISEANTEPGLRASRISLSAADLRHFKRPDWSTADVGLRAHKGSRPLNHSRASAEAVLPRSTAEVNSRRTCDIPSRPPPGSHSKLSPARCSQAEVNKRALTQVPTERVSTTEYSKRVSTHEIAIRKTSMPTLRPVNHEMDVAMRKQSLPVQAELRRPTPTRPRQRKRGFLGIFSRKKSLGVVFDPSSNEFHAEDDADIMEPSPANNLRRMVSNWQLRRSSMSNKPKSGPGDQYVQFMGKA